MPSIPPDEETGQWDIFPEDANIVTGLSVRLDAGVDETITGRFYQTTDNEQVTPEVSSSATGQVWSGWEHYTPTTTDEPLFIQYQHKTSVGANESKSFAPVFWVGVQL